VVLCEPSVALCVTKNEELTQSNTEAAQSYTEEIHWILSVLSENFSIFVVKGFFIYKDMKKLVVLTGAA